MRLEGDLRAEWSRSLAPAGRLSIGDDDDQLIGRAEVLAARRLVCSWS